MRVWVKFERVFSTCSSPALKHSSEIPVRNVFVPRAENVHLQHSKRVHLLLEGGLEAPRKQQKLGKKVSVKLHFS